MGPFDQQAEPTQQPQQNYQNQPIQQQTKYAGFWIRLLANMVDGMIVSVAMGLFLLLFFLVLGSNGLIVAYIVWILSYFIYFIYATTKYQATLGKKLVGVMVLTGEGEKATVGKIALRELVGKMVSSMIFSIGYMMAGFTERKRALHDMMADTVVVYKDPLQEAKSGIVVLIIIGGMIISGVEGYIFTNIAKGMALKQSNLQLGQAKSSERANSTLKSVQPSNNIPVTTTVDNNYVATAPIATQNIPASNTTSVSSQSAPVQSQSPVLDNDMIDRQAKNKMETILAHLVLNFNQNKTYSGVVLTDELAMPINNSTCVTKTKLDIHPNGQSFVIHRPICATALTQSFCLETGTQIVTQVSTEIVTKTYHCK